MKNKLTDLNNHLFEQLERLNDDNLTPEQLEREAKRGDAMVFEAHQRRIRFDLPLPEGNSDKNAQAIRQRWRALLLCIKAKLESVESKIESFEDAFLAHVVMPDGRSVSDHVRPRIEQVYAGGEGQALLPTPAGKKGEAA